MQVKLNGSQQDILPWLESGQSSKQINTKLDE
jgi:hypothetical protein